MPRGISAFASSGANGGPDVHRFDELVDHTRSPYNILGRNMLGPLTSIPHGLLLKAATHGLALLIGMAIANSWATRQALEVQADVHAKEQAAVSQALIIKAKDDQRRVNEAAKQQATAYDAALFVYEQGMEDASKGRAVAERQLAAEFKRAQDLTENIDALKSVNKMLAEEFPLPEPPAGCIMPPSVRVAIDDYIRSINNRPASGATEAPTARVPDGADSANTPLACRELASGVTAILEHDAMQTAWIMSWQSWANSLK